MRLSSFEFKQLLKLSTVLFLFLALTPSIAKLKRIDPDQPIPANRFEKLAEEINQTVVNISTTKMIQFRQNQRFQQDPFFDLFEQFLGPGMRPRPQQGLGTGFLIRKDGLILTNNHVVEGADVIKVQLSENDKDVYEAELIGADKRTDVALIKINAKKPLPAAQLGSSKDIKVGEWVVAFGNPFGHGHSMTKGIISAIGREIDELNKFPFLQTDASINPGNSGGPLVNLNGEVIGVNTAIDARAQGIGFAIPIDNVKSILNALEKEGGIKRGFMGVALRDLSPSGAKSLGLKTADGALIAEVVDDSPASKAGLKPYDFVIKFNNKKITSSEDLLRAVADSNANSKVKLEIIRDAKLKNITMTLGTHPDDIKVNTSQGRSYKGQKAPFDLGFKTSKYTDSIAQSFGLPKLQSQRPVVIDVDYPSKASAAGLEVGDIILDVNRKPVYQPLEVNKNLKKGQTNILRILRQNRALLVFIQA